jgi:hypothetical protein
MAWFMGWGGIEWCKMKIVNSKIMGNEKDEMVDFFKRKILDIFKPIKIVHIGSNSATDNQNNEYDYKRDFDFIIVVEDTINCYEYIKQISSILKEIIVKYGLETHAYPIKDSIYKDGESEFLKNVRQEATEIWKKN